MQLHANNVLGMILLVEDDINHLFAVASQQDKSRLLAVTSFHSSDWLHALLIASSGFRLENEDIRVAVDLRLGAALCQAHQCPCGALVEVNGLHCLSCKLGTGKHSRHASINDIVYRACCRANIEPTGLIRTEDKRPDGSTLVQWSAGKYVLWDVTIADTKAPYSAAISSVSAGLVAEQSFARKFAKYMANYFRTNRYIWSLLVLYVQKHLFFLVNLDFACLLSSETCAKRPFFFNVYPLPFNVLTVFYLKVLLLTAKMSRSHFYLIDLDQ